MDISNATCLVWRAGEKASATVKGLQSGALSIGMCQHTAELWGCVVGGASAKELQGARRFLRARDVGGVGKGKQGRLEEGLPGSGCGARIRGAPQLQGVQ